MPIQSQAAPVLGNERFALALDPVRDQSINAQLRRIQDFSNALVRKLRDPQPINEFVVTDPATGRMVFWVGTRAGASQLYKGFWGHDGYLGGDDPENAPLYAEDGRLTIVLGDADDAAGLTVLDGDGNVVVQMGKFGDLYGIHALNAWFGTTPEDAVVKIVGGELTIAGGDILLGPGDTGNGGNLYVYDATDVVVKLGTFAVATAVAVSSTNAGTVNTSTAHGLAVDDWTRLEGNSNAAHDGVWKVTAVGGANTFSVSGMTGTGSGGTSTKQQAGAYSKIIRAGGTDSVDARFATEADGSLRIGVAGGARLEVDSTGDLSLTDATLEIDLNGVTTSVKNLASSYIGTAGIKVQNNTSGKYSELGDLGLVVASGLAVLQDEGASGYGQLFLADTGGNRTVEGTCDPTFGPYLRVQNQAPGPNYHIEMSVEGGTPRLIVNAAQVVGSQQAAIPNATMITTQTAGGAYTANEAVMLNNLKTDMGVVIGRINNMLLAGRTHGLIAT
jgi:hypothetical protein